MNEIKFSVIIPFYNARDFVVQAVESALMQPETGEVLLIEDNSPDDGLIICQELADRHSKVRLLRHPDGQNHGAAASRNLGIRTAIYPYVAFLDADDFFLPKRFIKTVEIFQSHPDADGVYEAIGATFQNEEVKDLFTKLHFSEITTIREKIDPEQLFEKFINGHIGHFSFDGLALRRQAFSKTGFFSEELKVFEDTELIFRLCAKTILLPGSIETPIAIRRVHSQNRITKQLSDKRNSYYSYNTMWNSLYKWGQNNLTPNQQILVLRCYISQLRKIDSFVDYSAADYFSSRKCMLKLGIEFPSLFLEKFFWRRIIPSREAFKSHGSN